MMCEVLFWIFLFIVVYTYVGYGLILYIMVKLKEKFFVTRTDQSNESDFPEVTLFIAAYNEEAIIHDKMVNINALNYPEGKLKVMWVTDGSSDRTNELLKSYPNVEVYHQPERRGKTAAINRGMKYVKTPIVIFTDANTMLNEEAIVEIAKCFRDSNVGCVAGEKRIFTKDKDQAVSSGEGFYWKYESMLKRFDSRLKTTIGAAGELFAIRTGLYQELENDTLLDDFMLSMRIAAQGYKIEYCPSAYAMEEASLDMREEEKRKIRIAAGGLQSIIRLIHLLSPFKYGILSFQYISHRVLRWTITPFALFLLIPLNISLITTKNMSLLYLISLSLQIIFYLFAGVGKALSKRNLKLKIFFIPYYFVFMNFNVFKGINYLVGNKTGIWEKAGRQKTQEFIKSDFID